MFDFYRLIFFFFFWLLKQRFTSHTPFSPSTRNSLTKIISYSFSINFIIFPSPFLIKIRGTLCASIRKCFFYYFHKKLYGLHKGYYSTLFPPQKKRVQEKLARRIYEREGVKVTLRVDNRLTFNQLCIFVICSRRWEGLEDNKNVWNKSRVKKMKSFLNVNII